MEQIVRTDEEVNEVINKAYEIQNNEEPGNFGMTYEQGLTEMWEWLTNKDINYLPTE